ncbi:hypothetical protein ED208_07255 [Stagnimonas aquatica]|uniref:Uncharacterized protein n=1 Tax=Stagnimonas aquatica TaxID=2689987 RepID=A0A3N0VHB3_9GAMM|nr:hypothetical protein [Stagnimonas aquatica]ROH92156.1 hypothetical protein ED208_07255 [Stagnimonas aquatica]
MRRILLAALALGALALGVYGWSQAHRDGPAIAELAKHAAVTDPAATSSRVLSRADLPPELVGDDGVARGTRSLFDHLVAQADGVPWPFEKLVALLAQQDPSGAAPLSLLIPDGRSLLKGQADYAHPRVLVAADFQAPGTPASLGLAPRGQLFLGYTEQANEIEVISYNELAGRYEFQLVQDYRANGARRLVYAQRAICESCHQGGSPIFSVRPWNETNGQPETAAKIAAAVGGERYLGFATAAPLAAPERYDELTDVGAYLVAAQKLWLDRCADAACRRQLLKLALDYARAPGDFHADSAGVAELRRLQAASGAGAIAVPQSDLPNRDPIGEGRGIKGYFRSLFKPSVKLGDGAKTNADLEAFDRLPKLPAAQDPLTPRAPKRLLGAADIDGIYALASLFTPDDLRRLQAAAGYDWSAVERAVDRLPAALFAEQPVARVPLMQALLAPGLIRSGGVQATAAGAVPGYCCLETAEMSPPISSGEPPVQLAAGSPIEPFAHYCFACHRGNPSKRLNFMSGATEAEVAANLKAKPEIRDALDWQRYRGTDKAAKLMPPADAPQHAALEEALKQNPQLLDEMRAVVPGLFDF